MQGCFFPVWKKRWPGRQFLPSADCRNIIAAKTGRNRF